MRKLFSAIMIVSLVGMVVSLMVWAAEEATITATVTVQHVSVSVSDGSVDYGTMPVNTCKSTLPTELNDMQTATNDGNVTEDFNIKGQNSASWTLATTTGSDQYTHQFCNDTDLDCSAPPNNYTYLTTSYQTLDTGVPAASSTEFQLRICTPTATTDYSQQSVDVTVQAVASGS